MKLEKWIEVEGKMMDSVEFTRFIRKKTSPEIEKMLEKKIEEQKKNKLRLEKLQELA